MSQKEYKETIEISRSTKRRQGVTRNRDGQREHDRNARHWKQIVDKELVYYKDQKLNKLVGIIVSRTKHVPV